MKKFIVLFSALLIFTAVFFGRKHYVAENHLLPAEEDKASPPTAHPASPPTAKTAPAASPVAAPGNPDIAPEALLRQARAMNRTFPNAQAAQAEEQRLERVAAALTDSDRAYLVQQVTSAEAGDNVRALSLYLLTLAPSTTPENLKAIALMANPVAGQPLAAHSPEEWADRTVKAFATGAVGELKRRLPQDPSIVRDLQEISQQASMPIVKKMAKAYLREAESREPASLKARKK